VPCQRRRSGFPNDSRWSALAKGPIAEHSFARRALAIGRCPTVCFLLQGSARGYIPPVHRIAFSWIGSAVALACAACAWSADTKPAPDAPDVVALTEKTRRSLAVVTHYGRDGRQEGVGTGFVVERDGLIATCLHVIGEARRISVKLADGRRFDVSEVFASDRKLDLALVRIPAAGLTPLKLGDSDALQQGAPVIAMGNPVGLEHSVVQGIVSAKRDFNSVEMIQLAMPIESGNSGGPLLDAKGRVHGLLNMKSAVTANLGFAVPVNALKALLERPNPVPMDRWLTLGALSPREWQPLMGARWTRKAGRIEVNGLGAGFGGRSLCLSQRAVPELPYEVAVTVKLDDEAGAAGLAFESDGGDRHYGFYPTAGQMRLTRFDGPNVFSWTILNELTTPHYKPGDWNHLRVRVETNRIQCFVNGALVIESSDTRLRGGRFGLAKFRDTTAEFKGFQVGKEVPKDPAAGVSAKEMASLAKALRTEKAHSDAELAARLRDTPPASHAALLEHARQLDERAAQLRRVALRLHEETVVAELAAALQKRDDHAVDLFHAALLVAKLDAPELDTKVYRDEMRRMGEEFRAGLSHDASESNKVAALTRFLFVDNGFHGSRTDYYNRANSYMHAVLDDREGLPITLAILYLELARAAGLTNLFGVPVPTHFMVAFRPPDGPERLIDVFDQGKFLTRSEAVEMVADNVESIGEEDFRAARPREIIVRMLRNLQGIAQRTGSATDTLRYLNAIIAIEPDSAVDRLTRARLHMQRRDTHAAKADLRWLLDHKPDGLDLERLEELYRSLGE
jgi:serine protease Do